MTNIKFRAITYNENLPYFSKRTCNTWVTWMQGYSGTLTSVGHFSLNLDVIKPIKVN